MFITYYSDDGPQKPSISTYKLGQALPPQHWYQKRVGWFGRTITTSLMVGLIVFAAGSTMTVSNNKKTFAAQASQAASLEKTKSTISSNPNLENIVDIQSVLDQWNTEHKGQKWAVVAKSLSGASFDARLNADQQFESASIYKLFLTLPLFNQIPVEQQAKTSLNTSSGKKTIATCVDLMLRVSNNECGEAVGGYLNWTKATNQLKQKGYTHTDFTKSEFKTSAGDTAAFLEALNGTMLPPAARDTIMKSLYQQRYRDGIPAGCPGCTVANKTGQVDNVTHDAAIVQYKGGTYILVILSGNGSANFKQISQLTGRIQQKILDATQ